MRWVCLMGLFLAGCDDSFEPAPIDTSVDDDDGCPEGLSVASDAWFVATQFTVNGIGLATDFGLQETYDGVPAACVSADGLSVRLIFEVAGEGFGSILLNHSGAGSYDANGTEDTFSLDLFGADVPTTYVAGDWQTASWNVEQSGGSVLSDFFGTGFSGEENVGLNVQLSVTP